MAIAILLSSVLVRSTSDIDRRLARRRSQLALWVAVVMLWSLSTSQATCSCAAEPELSVARFLLTWGKEGTKPGEFQFPIGIAINPADELLITDHYNHRVQRFDTAGKLLGHFDVLPNPGGIALDKAGNVYLSHFPTAVGSKGVNPDRLTVYSPAGKLLHAWGKSGHRVRVNSAIRAGWPSRKTAACM